MENNEDIKIVEELVCQKYSERLLNTLSMAKEEDEVYILTINERQAIENLLSRLKTAEKMNDVLAEVVDLGMMDFNCSPMCIHDNCIKECALEWARNKAKESE